MKPPPVLHQVSLKSLHTFGLDIQAERFARFSSESELLDLLKTEGPPAFLLGGGSNVLFTGDVQGLVLQNRIGGMELVEENEQEVLLAVGGGVLWHDLVEWTLNQNLGGLENLSLIPGRVGAAPIQNIGAYGVELQSVFHHLDAIELFNQQEHRFDRSDCQFGYRDSIFKNEWKGRLCITRVYLTLQKKPTLNLSYGAIQEVLDEWQLSRPTIRDVSKAVIHIRQSKLPDPAVLGNAGSFFKNPIIPIRQLQDLQRQHPEMVFYPNGPEQVKVPAGWLIEHCGWKGKRIGNTGCHADQSLVLVNYGGATGAEVLAHAQRVIQSVQERFGITLQPEVNII